MCVCARACMHGCVGRWVGEFVYMLGNIRASASVNNDG